LVSNEKEDSMEPDYRDMEKPAYIRNRRAAGGQAAEAAADLDYLDIPAFLRRQAD
jgi:cell division protein FtsZ